VVIAGATTSTGRLAAGLACSAFGGANVTLIVNKDAQASYWPEGMPTEVAEQRMYATEAELVKATLVDPRDATPALAAATTLVFCAEWGATAAELAEALLPQAGANLKRCVMLSRVGINRRDKVPFVVEGGVLTMGSRDPPSFVERYQTPFLERAASVSRGCFLNKKTTAFEALAT
jgi:hypothetical protein